MTIKSDILKKIEKSRNALIADDVKFKSEFEKAKNKARHGPTTQLDPEAISRISTHLEYGESLLGKDPKTAAFAVQWKIRGESGKSVVHEKTLGKLLNTIKEKIASGDPYFINELGKSIDLYRDGVQETHDTITRAYVDLRGILKDLVENAKEIRPEHTSGPTIISRMKFGVENVRDVLLNTKKIVEKQDLQFIREVEIEISGGQKTGGELHRLMIGKINYSLFKAPLRFTVRQQARGMITDLYKEFTTLEKQEKKLVEEIRAGKYEEAQKEYKNLASTLTKFNTSFEDLTKRMYGEQYAMTIHISGIIEAMAEQYKQLESETKGANTDKDRMAEIKKKMIGIGIWGKKVVELRDKHKKMLDSLRMENHLLNKEMENIIYTFNGLDKSFKA